LSSLSSVGFSVGVLGLCLSPELGVFFEFSFCFDLSGEIFGG
jgi:hypothetical protein